MDSVRGERGLLRVVHEGLSRAAGRLESLLPAFTLLFLVLGLALGRASERSFDLVRSAGEVLIGAYAWVAPVLIYLLLTATLVRIMASARAYPERRLYRQVVTLFEVLRLGSLVWGCAFTAWAFGLPWTSGVGEGVGRGAPWFPLHSPYFQAVALALVSGFVVSRVAWLCRVLARCSEVLEASGVYLVPFVPLITLALGVYLYHLPEVVRFGPGTPLVEAARGVRIFGVLSLHPDTPLGILSLYLAGAALTGLACFAWHGALLAAVKLRMGERFSLQGYFAGFWGRSYPLLWSTCSESLALPLMLHLVKTGYRNVRDGVRQIVLGEGAHLNINGTLIGAYVTAGLCLAVLGHQVSLVQLLSTVPWLFLLGYSVPGVPGELLLFAGPLLLLLGVPQELAVPFLVLYLGLQVGLADSFRTGANSTDSLPLALLVNEVCDARERAGVPGGARP